MKRENMEALLHGQTINIKTNVFTTDRGVYTINLREYQGDIYFFKYRDGELLECLNVSKQARYERRENS